MMCHPIFRNAVAIAVMRQDGLLPLTETVQRLVSMMVNLQVRLQNNNKNNNNNKLYFCTEKGKEREKQHIKTTQMKTQQIKQHKDQKTSVQEVGETHAIQRNMSITHQRKTYYTGAICIAIIVLFRVVSFHVIPRRFVFLTCHICVTSYDRLADNKGAWLHSPPELRPDQAIRLLNSLS